MANAKERVPFERYKVNEIEFDELMSVGIDFGKDGFHLFGFDPNGQRGIRQQINRLALVATFETLPRCIFGSKGVRERILSAGLFEKWLFTLHFSCTLSKAVQ